MELADLVTVTLVREIVAARLTAPPIETVLGVGYRFRDPAHS